MIQVDELTLPKVQAALREIQQIIQPLHQGNFDMRGRRIINAGEAVSPFDYVRKFDMESALKTLSSTASQPISDTPTGALSIVTSVRVAPYATRGSAISHDRELFIASDLYSIGFISVSGTWYYAFGIYPIAQSGLSTLAGTLGSGDIYLKAHVTDYEHILQWSGSAWTWGPGEVGSGYYAMFETTPGTVGSLAWQVCDGSTVARLNSNGTTTNVTVPDVSTSAYLKGGTSAAAVAAASGNTPSGTVSQPTFTGNAVAAASTNATPDLVAPDITGTGVSPVTTATGTVSQPTFTGNAMSSLELRNKQAIMYYRR